jgi:hypothetical protein
MFMDECPWNFLGCYEDCCTHQSYNYEVKFGERNDTNNMFVLWNRRPYEEGLPYMSGRKNKGIQTQCFLLFSFPLEGIHS